VTEFTLKPVGALLDAIGRQPKIKRSAYQESGLYPIIDQSQAEIAGYTDDKSWLYTGELPVVVFGDHTRVLKYVDFPFCVGADGTQLLRPVAGYDIRYVYYALRNIELRNYGYERHFKYLKEEEIPTPLLPDQRRIAGILSTYDELIENSQRRIRILEAMARALYREWFVHFRFPGHETHPRVASPLGDIPQGWQVKTVADSFEISVGGTPSRKESEYWEGGTIQWFSPSDLTGAGTMFMDDSNDHITELGLAQSSARLFPARTVMLTSRATIGAIAINTHEACTNQGFITCIPNERVPLYFLFHWVTENVPTFQRLASGATFKEISRGVFKTIEFLQPPANLVRRFENTAAPMAKQALTLQRQIQTLRRTRDLLLPRLLSGQVNLKEN
jgi:type I restriction enzyme S subunit